MRAIQLLTIFALLSTCSASTANDWKDTVTREGKGYSFSVPRSWRYMQPKANGPEHYLEASGIALPATQNDAPVITSAFIVTFPAESQEDATQRTLRGYDENPDRVFPPGPKYQEEELRLSSGENASMLSTRFYRKSKGLQQSRYDLVVFMPQKKRALLYTLSVQYADETYKLERKLELRKLAERIFAGVSILK